MLSKGREIPKELPTKNGEHQGKKTLLLLLLFMPLPKGQAVIAWELSDA